MAKQQNKNGKINPLTVGIAGAAAVAAGAAAVALSKKSNRKKAGKMLKNIKSKGGDLSKRASVGLDKVLKEESKLRKKVQNLRTKTKSSSVAKKQTKKSSPSKKKSTGGVKKSAGKSAGASHGRSTNGMVN